VKPRTIVSVLDSSSAAPDTALLRALSLARWYESDLHVLDLRPARSGDEDDRPLSHEALDERISRGARAAGAAGVVITPTRLAGSAVPAVADYAARVAADLVVVGTEPRRRDGYWSAGSFAAALGTAVSAPTMAIAGDPAPVVSRTPFSTILAAVDFSPVSLTALLRAVAIAGDSGGRVKVVHVLEGYPYDATYSGAWALHLIDELDARIARVNRQLRAVVRHDAGRGVEIDVATVTGVAADAIVTAAAEEAADLIVLGLPRRHRFEQLVAGSTAHKVVRRANAPVLLVPGPAAARLFDSAEDRAGYLPLPSMARWSLADPAVAADRAPSR
jgi:nucleotide-binding universal stress UspA family protein